jgi:DNA-binding XRE family transcriptional regulator
MKRGAKMELKIGKTIKELRTERGITMAELADALSVTPQSVSRWESGTSYPDIEMLGPSEAPVSIVRKRHRFHIILKGGSLDLLREAAEYGQNFMNLSRKSKTLRILIDVEPSSVL